MATHAGEAFAGLSDRPRFGDGPGLHRMAAVLAALPQPGWLAGLDAVRVTGSNGKGSTTAMVDAVLRQLEISCGRFVSPHVLDPHERIAVDGGEIEDAQAAAAVAWFRGFEEEYRKSHPADAFGAFEAWAAVALRCFADRAPETVVAEAGIGGRFDATRAIPGRVVALTSVDLEHTSLLGRTRAEIAYDKADLCPEGGTLIAGRLDPEILRRLRGYCAVRGVEVVATGDPEAGFRLGRARLLPGGTVVDLELPDLEIPELTIGLLGEHQAANALVAATAAREWLRRHRPKIAAARFEGALRTALAGLAWPGRFERVARDPEVWVDVGHTPEALVAVARTASSISPGRRWVLLVAVSAGRDPSLLAPLLPLAATVVISRSHHRGGPTAAVVEEIARRAPELPWEVAEPLEEGLAQALEGARRTGSPVLVAGGFFVAAEAVRILRGLDPRGVWAF